MSHTLPPNLETLIAEFTRSGVRELHVRSGCFELFLSNDPLSAGSSVISTTTAPTAARTASKPPAPPTIRGVPSAAADLPPGAIIVSAPNLGTFYRAPKPGAAAYVELGATVAVGQELCLIEVMKLFTSIRAEVAGRLHAVLAEEGAMVEAGQPLFAILAD